MPAAYCAFSAFSQIVGVALFNLVVGFASLRGFPSSDKRAKALRVARKNPYGHGSSRAEFGLFSISLMKASGLDGRWTVGPFFGGEACWLQQMRSFGCILVVCCEGFYKLLRGKGGHLKTHVLRMSL